ncbi:MAG: hypothetical protein ACXWXO_06540 [Nocardioides sp.]
MIPAWHANRRACAALMRWPVSVVARLFEVVCPEAADEAEGKKLEKEEAAARRKAHFSVRDNGDGTSDGKFKLPTLDAHLLKKALEALPTKATTACAASEGHH